MQTEIETVEIGSLSIEIPAGCPDAVAFSNVIAEEFQSAFGQDAERAAVCKFEHARCQQTPAPFSANWQAASHYQQAQMALSPAAQKWASFEHSVTDRFSDFSLDDGSSRTPAIAGWRLDQMKVVEPTLGSWRERRPSAKPAQSPAKDKGRG